MSGVTLRGLRFEGLHGSTPLRIIQALPIAEVAVVAIAPAMGRSLFASSTCESLAPGYAHYARERPLVASMVVAHANLDCPGLIRPRAVFCCAQNALGLRGLGGRIRYGSEA